MLLTAQKQLWPMLWPMLSAAGRAGENRDGPANAATKQTELDDPA
jgi:hypothetical protein